MEGLIVKGIGGFYYVKGKNGITQAKGRGIFKKDGDILYVGDRVLFEVLPDGDGIITKILPRKNCFIRPPIANVDVMVIVLSVTKPKPNFVTIDRLLVMAEKFNMEVLICVNKVDLLSNEKTDEIIRRYSSIYPVIATCTMNGVGILQLQERIQGKTVALAGPSGVGKSSLTNALVPHANTEIGRISEKTKRGKHTTRHVEIFEIAGDGLIFDTPGFTSFDLHDIEPAELAGFYPDIEKYSHLCRFDDCFHRKEPDCGVICAVEEGKIDRERYKSYLLNLEELEKRQRF